MSEDCATTTHLGEPCGPRCIFTPEPPPLSIVVDDHSHAWQAFVTTDGSGGNLWYPASPRWGGHSIPAKTWDELQALGTVRVLAYGRVHELHAAVDALAESSVPAHAPGYLLAPVDLVQRLVTLTALVTPRTN